MRDLPESFTEDPNYEHLACAHKFQTYCLEKYMEVASAPSLEQLDCPQCKLDAQDVREVEEQLLNGQPASEAPWDPPDTGDEQDEMARWLAGRPIPSSAATVTERRCSRLPSVGDASGLDRAS